MRRRKRTAALWFSQEFDIRVRHERTVAGNKRFRCKIGKKCGKADCEGDLKKRSGVAPSQQTEEERAEPPDERAAVAKDDHRRIELR
jgi:hypothetical protein